MSPGKIYSYGQEQRVINGARPSPLRISKDSYGIHKPTHVAGALPAANEQRQKPVIIYAYSPKIIHTKPRDFMALVQRLTGLSRPEKETAQPRTTTSSSLFKETQIETKLPKIEENGSSSFPLLSPGIDLGPGSNQFLAEIPLFTPNSTNWFLSPGSLYRFSDPVSSSPNMFESKKELNMGLISGSFLNC
ncbi:VQ motif-containing protein 8, chloroplastic [Diospyros lotus]|uniref:VQ motif-containing protein 8, chloroplastic n=1 Tax=Diospyros lotus TaxID=55363 RepID=UPI002259D60D|nr:VQ motif-containing protein 8, chloroplastic [Diospyros lotus]